MQEKTFQIRRVIGENIREGRRRLEVTQEQFAQEVELSVQFVSALENGMQFARMDTYCKIAEIIKIPLHALFISQQSQDDMLDKQHQIIFSDCETDEKKALLNIIVEIKAFLRKQRSSAN